ncbi:MAG: DUF4292 domain-containing protein [Prolixibacteraceae bacterium]|nr:DUF4292 domain-containing protein [Prolixibacteraceae bacterium]
MKNILKIALWLSVFSVLLFSCKTRERATRLVVRPVSISKLVKNIEENRFDFPYFSAKRINFSFDNDGEKNSFRATLQIIRERQISLSIMKLSIPVGRVALSPDSLIFLNYFERTFVADKMAALESLLGFSADYNMIQTLLSGDVMSLFPEDKLEKFDLSIEDGFYKLQSGGGLEEIPATGGDSFVRLKNDKAFSQVLYFDPDLFVLRKMVLTDATNTRTMRLEMNEYEKIGSKYYPAAINVNFDSTNGIFKAEAKMSGFSTEKIEYTPVRIPANYQRLFFRK